MRRRLILMFLAVSTMVAIAFVVPLGFLVLRTAEDRAIDIARADAAAVVPTLVTGGSREQIEQAVARTRSGRDGRMTVMTWQGWAIGLEIEPSARVRAALSSGASDIGDTEGGVEVVAAVASGTQQLSAIRVLVTDAELRSGQWRAWGTLAAVGAILVGISVLVADRLARTLVRSTQDLAFAARRLGDGDLEAAVEPNGPDELVELAGAFNDLGSQVSSMLERERELVAELSHRLRTPLTKLRMRLDQVTDAELAGALREDVEGVTDVVNDLIREARGTLAGEAGSNLSEVVVERAEFWAVLAEDQERPWQFERGEQALWVGVSRSDLSAAVDVLLENVFAHTPEGSALTIGFERQGGSARLWVADAGDGIDPSSVARGESSAGSTGLGLDIARVMAANGGGTLEVSTSSLGGAEVEISLPLKPGGGTKKAAAQVLNRP